MVLSNWLPEVASSVTDWMFSITCSTESSRRSSWNLTSRAAARIGDHDGKDHDPDHHPPGVAGRDEDHREDHERRQEPAPALGADGQDEEQANEGEAGRPPAELL